MTTKGFIITSPGDPSVGIMETSWVLHEEFHFDFASDMFAFMDAIKQAFADYVADDVYVETIEQRAEWIEKQNQQSQS